ncbi:hypothetical protein ACHAP5_012222 [Fusarium lateritium]
MALSVFHPFARLPLELRLQIWEAACVGSSASHRGLQYIDVRNNKVVSIPCNWPKAPGQIFTTEINRSAYLIDGGLWKACKESREVIAKSTHFEDWVRIQKRAIFDFKYFDKYSADWSGGNESPHPASIDTCEGEEECRMLVYPANDIFCIRVADWTDVQQQDPDPEIYTSLFRYKKNDDDDDDEDDVGWSLLQKLYLKNIALEFDSSWLLDLPDSIFWLADENSARGYLTKLLKQKAYHYNPDDRFNPRREGIWIVDKEAKWFNNDDEHYDTVYRDCDGEYVEVRCDRFVHDYPSKGADPNATIFLKKLDHLGFEDCYIAEESPGGWMGPYNPEAGGIARILVRRDNEVKELTGKCKRKCYRLGWCICSDDEGEWWEDEDEDVDMKLSENKA